MATRILTFLLFCAFFSVIADSQIHGNKKQQPVKPKLSSVLKNGDTLTIYLQNGASKKYINKLHEDETYTYEGILPKTNYLLFHYEYRSGEVTGFLLVNGRNGSQCSIPGKPILSPDKKRFATSCVDLEAQYNPNSFSIYRFDKDSCRIEYSIEPTDWGATKIRWLNNSSLEFQKSALTETGMKPIGKSVLELKKKRWNIKE
jgi:hypothetical protein